MQIPSLFNSSCAYVCLEIAAGLANGLQLFSNPMLPVEHLAKSGISGSLHVVASLSYCDASTKDEASPC
jgi:hypothetical protein